MSGLYDEDEATGIAWSVKRLPTDPELCSGVGLIPTWADYLVGFFQGFPQPQQLTAGLVPSLLLPEHVFIATRYLPTGLARFPGLVGKKDKNSIISPVSAAGKRGRASKGKRDDPEHEPVYATRHARLSPRPPIWRANLFSSLRDGVFTPSKQQPSRYQIWER
ncbi:hypothetical protein ANN_18610 [Periplaneta americana]|uniref:Uncharacterized protein n=1 Tax=Periplaneta americana TaxID=6978 RepID=A0ABQ8SP84_PERAM|nr:hypothetical protein ANN_18610 [Periplaneta americana]